MKELVQGEEGGGGQVSQRGTGSVVHHILVHTVDHC